MNADAMARADGLGASVEAVPAESLDAGARLWSEQRSEVYGTVVEVEELTHDQLKLHWRHKVNEDQGTVTQTIVPRDRLIVVVCGQAS